MGVNQVFWVLIIDWDGLSKGAWTDSFEIGVLV